MVESFKNLEVHSPEKVKMESAVSDWLKNLEDGKIKLSEEFEYPSTYGERFDQTPCDGDRGNWTGDRGESEYIPADDVLKDLLNEKGVAEGINYENAIPDFSPVSEASVEINNMTDNRIENFRQCDENCAAKWNDESRGEKTDWTGRDVANWRRENGYSWHERNDMKTCDLVPTQVNAYFGHFGGVGECKKANSQEDKFDE